jgi:CyaY protein
MTETEFLEQAERTLAAIEAAVETVSEDLDIEMSRAGNVLTLELANGSKVIINSQAPTRQLWVAAKSGGFHYARAEDGTWRDTRDGAELFGALSKIVSGQGGVPVVLVPR